jgi:pimeloyl-ACP methyl ester carboxylesterase
MTTGIRAGGMTFTADVAGTDGWPLVLMLHGFPQTRHSWRHQLGPLGQAGYRAVAVDQRGYSSGARPPETAAYATGLLVHDALAIADACGAERFHLVGHDWGGHIAWLVAAHHPDRVRSLTVLSRPHPAAFAAAMRSDPTQAERSSHHRAFLDPGTTDRLLAADARALRHSLSSQGVADPDIDAYLEVLGQPAALESALNWYRAAAARGGNGLAAADVPPVRVPTLYIWGNEDATVGEAAARGTGSWVAGTYRFEVLPGVGHFVTDQAGERVTELLLDNLKSPAVRPH